MKVQTFGDTDNQIFFLKVFPKRTTGKLKISYNSSPDKHFYVMIECPLPLTEQCSYYIILKNVKALIGKEKSDA